MKPPNAIPQAKFTPDMAELCKLMSDISEDCYCAGWMDGNEYRLWTAVTDPNDDRAYGQDVIDTNDIARLRTLSGSLGGWIVCSDDDYELYFVPIEEWKARYDYATKRDTQVTVSTLPK